jgi:hypothetical protein
MRSARLASLLVPSSSWYRFCIWRDRSERVQGLRAESQRQLLGTSQIYASFGANSETIRLFRNALHHYEQLDPDEQGRYHFLVVDFRDSLDRYIESEKPRRVSELLPFLSEHACHRE